MWHKAVWMGYQWKSNSLMLTITPPNVPEVCAAGDSHLIKRSEGPQMLQVWCLQSLLQGVPELKWYEE